MADTDVQIPPIRTGLNDPDISGQTAKEWYLFWQKSGDRINTFNGMIAYGTHADRPDPAGAPDGAIYVEIDRGSVYQNLNGVWKYVTGTMWDTISPDHRPDDLGVNDGGFDFRTTDEPAREFIWSQTVWVEATPVRYGTHADRLAVVVANVIEQMLWVETDRSSVLYQLQGGIWQFVAGTMWGTISPDQRPTDLGVHDAGFDYRGTDQQREFIWSGTVWIETTPPQDNLLQFAAASGALTLPASAADIPGVSITLTRAGRHLITGCFDLVGTGSGDVNAAALGQLVADGSAFGQLAVFQPLIITSTGASGGTLIGSLRSTLFQQWSYLAPSAGKVVKLQAWKTGGTGTSSATTQSTISALWVSPT